VRSLYEQPPHNNALIWDINSLKNYMTLLPCLLTLGGHNNNDYHSALYVNNTAPPASTLGDPKTAIAMNTSNSRDAKSKEVIG
jgi:hypothetical protein